MAKPEFTMFVADKSTKKKTKVGVLFKNQFGYNFVPEQGVKITITHGWNKEAQAVTPLDTYVVATKETHFFNINPQEDKHPIEKAVEKTFKDDDGLPF